MTNPTPNLTNLAKACYILQHPIKSYQILPNPSNLTNSCQILAILPCITKSYQSYIESYQYYIEYDEAFTKSDQFRQSLLNLRTSHQIVSNPSNLTKSFQILAKLPSSTKSYQSYIESYQYYIEYDESYTKSDQSRQSLLYLTTSHRIVSNPSNLTKSCQILAILPCITKSY